ncbi:hypothetical protein JVU11DRAFT_3608 [Chiua virens]|nr:hypothetical protein JVU11DRAFT_3608 [Chiua virens]
MDSPTEVSDVFSLSDHLLAERLQFVKEIGFGNWGSVWLCRPKSSSGKVKDIEVAVKLVHRSKTSTTAARVRSLWNEMKIVRSFKNDPHPSIVPFHSFIITPSYALITMAHLPTLVPVEVSEPRAKEWFKSLLSGVHFLHSRGVVHNDIKPANILLSRANIPVLVDFGFAEKYDLSSPKAFHSNLTYGTPEYLSPERARGLPHDTRKSDIWSLGITFFEILVGRTPFEHEEGEVFEKKEDLERYWHRTMRGKWVGTFSLSQSVERFLKRMIVPDADLRCTALEMIGDAYWDMTPAPPHAHRKSASAAVPSLAEARTPSLLNPFRDSFREKEMKPLSRILDTSLPWSASRSTARFFPSRPPSRAESASRSASGLGTNSRSSSRQESTPRVALRTPSASQIRIPDSPGETSTASNCCTTSEPASPVLVSSGARPRTHSRSTSQPRLCSPPGISAAARTRKLSTVQASPIVRPQCQIVLETVSNETNSTPAHIRLESASPRRTPTLISLSSNSPLRHPIGPRQPSSRVTSVSAVRKDWSISSGQEMITEEKPPRTHLPSHLVTPRKVPKTPTQTLSHTIQTSQQPSVSNQLSGKPPRTRRRVGVLADLTGFARNVDLGAHGVGRPTRHDGEKRDRRKENTKTRITAQKENKENRGSSSHVPSRKDTRTPSKVSAAIPLSSKTDTTTTSLAINLSGAATVTRGSVRDRMMDWERLREMNRLADTSTEGHGDHGSTILTRTSTGSDMSDDDSGVEAEVAAEVASAQAKRNIPIEVQTRKEVNIDLQRPASIQTVTTISSNSSKMERGEIEVAKIGVRASAQILKPRNGSITALGQTTVKRPSEVGQDTVTDIGLPVEVPRHLELGLSSLKHSVKASIDKGVRFCKSSTLAQLTGRNTPVWCSSPEPIDFEQRRSGEEGRFSWENIRPEHEVAADRMNLWIQSVEKVVEETCQNFASTSITPPAPLPIAPVSRSSSLHYGTLNNSMPAIQSNSSNALVVSRSSRLQRRLLAANEIFAEPTGPDAPLSPAPSRGADASVSFSYVHTSKSSVPVFPSISVPMQTPRRRRATISTGTPTEGKAGPARTDFVDASPSKRREKSKSQSNLDRHIQDVAKLELELHRAPVSSPPLRLSAVLDRSLFVAPPLSPRFTEDSTTSGITCGPSIFQGNDLNPSPYHVELHPPRKSGELNTSSRRHLEGVYDRFLMATSGVKRVGKGYQSDNIKPVHNTVSTTEQAKPGHARGFGVFGAGKRPMPQPVSSEDAWRRSTTINEFGFITAGQGSTTSSPPTCKDESRRTFVHRAIKAMVPGKTISRRLSRTILV